MFVSHDCHESPTPPTLLEPGAQHWRLMQVMINAPWFILTVDKQDPESGIKLSHSWCIAQERDLLDVLTTMDTSKVQGLVCMLPARSSPSGHWTSREIHEVWVHNAGDDQSLALKDRKGALVDCGRLDQANPIEATQLVLRVRSRKRRAKSASNALAQASSSR